MIPEPWEFALLALAAFRCFWILAEDDIAEPVRRWLTADGERETVELFIQCGWCAGWWWSLAVWAAWLAAGDWAVAAAVPFALSATVGTVTVALHRLVD